MSVSGWLPVTVLVVVTVTLTVLDVLGSKTS